MQEAVAMISLVIDKKSLPKLTKKSMIMPDNAVQCFNTCKSNQHRM